MLCCFGGTEPFNTMTNLEIQIQVSATHHNNHKPVTPDDLDIKPQKRWISSGNSLADEVSNKSTLLLLPSACDILMFIMASTALHRSAELMSTALKASSMCLVNTMHGGVLS
jgi:hypothetical protein